MTMERTCARKQFCRRFQMLTNFLYQLPFERREIVPFLFHCLEANLKDDCLWELNFDEEKMELSAKIFLPTRDFSDPIICILVSFRKVKWLQIAARV